MKRKIVAVWVCAMMLVSAFVMAEDAGREVEAKAAPGNDAMYTAREPIRINSNADFDEAHGVSDGDGSAGNPWIIEGWEIDGGGYGNCIFIGNTTNHFIIRNCNLHNASGYDHDPYDVLYDAGINLYESENGRIENNIISYNGGSGIRFAYWSDNVIITSNHISHNGGAGIVVGGMAGCWNTLIENNTVVHNGNTGISVSHSNTNIILNNISSNNGDGISIYLNQHSIVGNEISWNTGSGIRTIWGVNSNTIAENNFRHNGQYGVLFDINCNGNEIYHNKFIGNLVYDDADNVNRWHNGYPSGGNYWSDYSGTDLYSGPEQNLSGSDGIGDTPYTNILGGSGAQDNYPLMEPWGTPTGPVRNLDKDTYHLTIQDAVMNADPGNTILAENGTYRENVVIPFPLTLKGRGNQTVIDGQNLNHALQILTDGAFIQSLSTRNCTSAGYYGIFANNSKNSTIDGIEIINCNRGVNLAYGSNSTVSNCRILGTVVGINLESACNMTISGNNVSAGQHAIRIPGDANYNVVSGNMIFDNRQYGITLAGDFNTVTNNTLANNGGTIGDGSYYSCISLGTANNNYISYNTIYSEVTTCINLYDSRYNTIEGNYICHTNDTYGFRGINIQRNSHYNIVRYNQILNSPDEGILIWHDCRYLQFTGNEFRNCNYAILYSNSGTNNPQDIQIYNNTILNSRKAGLFLSYYTNLAKGIRAIGNTIEGGQWGIYVTGVWDSVISNNTVTNCSTGIHITAYCQSNNVTFSGNLILNSSDYGIYNGGDERYNARNSKFYHNTFYRNRVHAVDTAPFNVWDNGYPSGGNYWDTYGGLDLYSGVNQNVPGSDGIGDTPHVIDPDSKDRYPLMLPLNFILPAENWFRIPVHLGWNLISIPFIQTHSSLPRALWDSDGDTLWDRLLWYNASDYKDPWKSCRPGGTMNDLHVIDNTQGLWMHVTVLGDGFINVSGIMPSATAITLYAGWNLVGYPSMTEQTVANALWGTGADRVEVCDPNSPTLLMVVGPEYVLRPGQGFWVRVAADTVWIVDW